jgi:hypothetical protein
MSPLTPPPSHPPPLSPFGQEVVTSEFTIASTVVAFDSATQQTFKASLANEIGVSEEFITLQIGASSIIVTTIITVPADVPATHIAARIRDLSSLPGYVILDVSDPIITTISSPLLPPPSSLPFLNLRSEQQDDGQSRFNIPLVAIISAAILLLVFCLAFLFCCKFRQKSKRKVWNNMKPWFYFVPRKVVLDAQEELPVMQKLRSKDKLVTLQIDLGEAVHGGSLVNKIAFVSHRWEDKSSPDRNWRAAGSHSDVSK